MTSTELAARELKLRPVRVDDEQALVAAHGAMMASDDFAMMLHYDAGKPFSDYVVQCQNLALGVLSVTPAEVDPSGNVLELVLEVRTLEGETATVKVARAGESGQQAVASVAE